MARRAAGPAGPLHSAQDLAPGERGAEDRAGTFPDERVPAAPGAGADDAGADDAEDLELLRASLLRGRAAHARPPLRVEDPVHPPPGAETVWAETWPEDAVDPDGLAGDESAVMHPDDLAALHALPTTSSETQAWAGAQAWTGAQAWAGDGAWATRAPEPAVRVVDGRRLVGTAEGLSLWDSDRSWDEDGSWDDGERAVGLLQRRWLQLTVCALLALVVGAALALLFTGQRLDAARAEVDRQRQATSSAQADLVRERAARASERAATTAPVPPPAPAALDEPSQVPAASAGPPASAPAAPPPTDEQRPPVAEAPAPTADPGPPPPGPSPTATATSDAPESGSATPGRSSTQDSATQDSATQGASTTPPDGQACSQAPDGTGGDGPGACP